MADEHLCLGSESFLPLVSKPYSFKHWADSENDR